MTLNAVVLPAPFGPMRPAISPSSTVSDSSSSARMPPKRRLTLSTSSSATVASFSQMVENRHVTTVQPRTANQPPPLEGYDLYGENRPLVEAVARGGAGRGARPRRREPSAGRGGRAGGRGVCGRGAEVFWQGARRRAARPRPARE